MKRAGPADRGSDTGVHRYHLTSTWQLTAGPAAVWEVFDALVDAADPFVWWPDLQVVRRDGESIHVVTRSGLGYRLRFRLHDVSAAAPHRVTFRADGDLVGAGLALIESAPDGASMLRIRWDVEVTRRWMRYADPVLKPVFVLAHAAVMRRGRRALEAWLARA